MEHEAWGWFLKHPNASIRLQAWQYLTDRRDGKPKQAVDVSGTLNHAAVPYRDPRLAGLSDDELVALDGLTRKLLPAVPGAGWRLDCKHVPVLRLSKYKVAQKQRHDQSNMKCSDLADKTARLSANPLQAGN